MVQTVVCMGQGDDAPSRVPEGGYTAIGADMNGWTQLHHTVLPIWVASTSSGVCSMLARGISHFG
jgi:hypothetical protein